YDQFVWTGGIRGPAALDGERPAVKNTLRLGDGTVAQLGPTVLTGRAAKTLKTTVGAGYLSSVGALRNAADLVSEELGYER
ncbi:NADH dehydrogenase FAD-containing subunit, partial [Halobacteriales archaeon SW_6_65_15]